MPISALRIFSSFFSPVLLTLLAFAIRKWKIPAPDARENSQADLSDAWLWILLGLTRKALPLFWGGVFVLLLVHASDWLCAVWDWNSYALSRIWKANGASHWPIWAFLFCKCALGTAPAIILQYYGMITARCSGLDPLQKWTASSPYDGKNTSLILNMDQT